MYETSVVLMAAGPKLVGEMPDDLRRVVGSAVEKTIGTGLILKIEGRTYVITCRHVAAQVDGPDATKAITSTGEILYLGNLTQYVHVQDSASETRDFVIVAFSAPLPPSSSALELHGREVLFPLTDGLPLEVWGYPVERLGEGRHEKPQVALSCVNAHYVSKSSGMGAPYNYERRVVAQRAAIVSSLNGLQNLEGMSGGLVVAVEDNRRHPVGMLTGSGSGVLRDIVTGKTERAMSIQFVPFSEIGSLKRIDLG